MRKLWLRTYYWVRDLVGPPVGKSELIRRWAKIHCRKGHTIELVSIEEAGSLKGLPELEKEETQ